MRAAHYASRLRGFAVPSHFADPIALICPAGAPAPYSGQPSRVHQLYVGVLSLLQSRLNSADSVDVLTSDTPPRYATLGLTVRRAEFEGMPIYTLQRTRAPSDRKVLYVHGGGYTAQPLIFQWLTVAAYARQTGATIGVPMYPLGGHGGTAKTVVPAMADLMTHVITEHGADNISILGDSAGGGLALAAVQEQVRRGDITAKSLVLFSPWLDVTLSDPRSRQINDPMLNADTLIASGKLWADTLDPTDPRVSPLFGPLAGLPPTTVYCGSRDLLAPDTLRLQQKAISDRAPITFGLRRDLIHCWQIFPFLPEAHADRPDIYRALNLE